MRRFPGSLILFFLAVIALTLPLQAAGQLQAPVLRVDRTALNFATTGLACTGGQTLRIGNGGSGMIVWTATASAPWIVLDRNSGSGSGAVVVSVRPGTLARGTYTGTVTVTAPAASSSPQVVTVTLRVLARGDVPWGCVDTPIGGQGGIAGNLPVTGWALDDIEVATVKIFRDPQAGEPAQPNGLVYIGDANFVAGARPDVAATYPATPLAYRAGWGYMLLTNFLPNGGNGTFRLHAVATDREGHAVVLGTRQITCDNAHATLPFGTIDTPAQGEVVTTNRYVNFGWALTPQPGTIPTDGSTIWVWVDGQPLGHPVYNQYRVDIATLFPGLNNSLGGVGYYTLDTTGLADGVHTIAWSVTNDLGATDGIGSRYFTVQHEELPPPTLANTFHMTFHLSPDLGATFASEAADIRTRFPDGRYKKMGLSDFLGVSTPWTSPLDQVETDLEPLFDRITAHLQQVREQNLFLHIGFLFGCVRNVSAYNAAKREDVRLCQIYSDGLPASPAQLTDEADALNHHVWLTLSRYATPLRARLRANARALGTFLTTARRDFPTTLLFASGDGEAELNSGRLDETATSFPVCDYGPFAVREFRDWICHEGIYADDGGEFAGQGYTGGGAIYQGEAGLARFNADFATAFTTWTLRYFEFDPASGGTKVPWSEFIAMGNLLPTTGAAYVAGGFDPPRQVNDGSTFWALWDRFRQALVAHYTADLAGWVGEGGFPAERWFSHQIPADYLWGNSPEQIAQGRAAPYLLSSASSLDTAFIDSGSRAGVTCFDPQTPAGHLRTSEFLIPELQSRGGDWALLEFDPFVCTPDLGVGPETDVPKMTAKFRSVYDAGCHLMAIHLWLDASGRYQYKGTAKVTALEAFWQAVEDAPRPGSSPSSSAGVR